MKKVEFYYLEVLNQTEQIMVFRTKFNKQFYGTTLTLNTALPVLQQDIQVAACVDKLAEMKTVDAKEASTRKHITK